VLHKTYFRYPHSTRMFLNAGRIVIATLVQSVLTTLHVSFSYSYRHTMSKIL